jgi:hypothetical protein
METTRMWKYFTTTGAQQNVNDHTEQDDARNKGTSVAVRGNRAEKQNARETGTDRAPTIGRLISSVFFSYLTGYEPRHTLFYRYFSTRAGLAARSGFTPIFLFSVSFSIFIFSICFNF